MFYENIIIEIKSFYENLKEAKFKNLKKEDFIKLKQVSKELNEFYNNEFNNRPLPIKYVSIMNKIKINPKKYQVDNIAEKFILFMFSVDPNFEAAKIYGESNHINEIKNKMLKYFGVYDKQLIIIEKYFIKHFLSDEKKNEINNEIEKRTFK